MIDIDEIYAWYNTEPDTYLGNIPRILMYWTLVFFIFFVLFLLVIYKGYCYILRRQQPDLMGIGFVLHQLNEKPELKRFKKNGNI
jgi:hypothetical protein